MRSLFQVIDEILEQIPVEESGLCTDLRSRRQSALCTPPECMRERWREVAVVLRCHLGDDTNLAEDWQRRVLEIWRGE